MYLTALDSTYYAQWGYTYAWSIWSRWSATPWYATYMTAWCNKTRTVTCLRNDWVTVSDTYCTSKPATTTLCSTATYTNTNKLVTCATICANNWKVCYKWYHDYTTNDCSWSNYPWDRDEVNRPELPWCNHRRDEVSCNSEYQTVTSWSATCYCGY